MLSKQSWAKAEIVITVCTLLLFTSIAAVNLLRPAPQRSAVSLAQSASMNPSAWVLHRPRIVLFGDSLTERSMGMGGWGASLAHTYLRRADVVNRGFGGYNTIWARHLMDEIFQGCTSDNTLLVTLFFGANDAAIPLPDGTPHSARQHAPVGAYRNNLKAMVADLKARGLNRIVLLTPPPVYEPGRKEAQRLRLGKEEADKLPLDRTNAYTKQYVDACKQVASELGLPVLDLWTSVQAQKDWGTTLLNDGLHFTVEGNQHVYAALQRTIDESFPELRAEALPMQFPAWDLIDPDNPAASLASP